MGGQEKRGGNGIATDPWSFHQDPLFTAALLKVLDEATPHQTAVTHS